MTLPTPPEAEIGARLAEIVRSHRDADTLAMRAVAAIGGRAEAALHRLPPEMRTALDRTTESALRSLVDMAARSRGVLPDQSARVSVAMTTALGAAGGTGGLPTALAELPVTVTMLFRAIQAVAVEHRFDPDDLETRKLCLSVFAEAGPLARDDGADTGFLATRIALRGTTVQAMIARVAPRLATALGQKLGAQAVPVLGAAAGAATNYAYVTFYTAMARVVFGLRALERDTGRSYPVLVAEMAARVSENPAARA